MRQALGVILLLVFGSAQAAVVVTAVETGGDVVFSTSGGTLDLTGLNLYYQSNSGVSFIHPEVANLYFMDDSGYTLVDLYDGFTSTPSDFGAGGAGIATSHEGAILGLSYPGHLIVERGFLSGDTIGEASTIYAGESFATLGLTPGEYVWQWATDSVTLNITAVPIPAAVWLFGSALAGLGWVRRKQTA